MRFKIAYVMLGSLPHMLGLQQYKNKNVCSCVRAQCVNNIHYNNVLVL